ncbi:hypothetical protein PVAND_016012 [Polypedilum vanderplanki]|uniref:Uncharacterized protein n=1 Tax=Polypedilum vanderplanki TaxID=319348 RepID=A0A9J6BEM4_POLVA|nr:hypothetical protein PVAND_016012 [Polypedilum vanderplanki]
MLVKVYQIAVIGDSLVGKTSLLRSFYGEENFSDYHLSSVCDKEITEIKIGTSTYKVKLIDTTGKLDLEDIEVDCYILCYSIENRLSFANVKNKWINLMKTNPKWPIPFIFVATKIDLRDELPNVPFLTSADGQTLCEDIGGKKFIETSAKEDVNTKFAIEAALQTVIPAVVVPTTPNLSKAKPKIVVSSAESEKKTSACCGRCQS